MSRNKLSPKEQIFVDQYILLRNGTEAAEKAGYKHPTKQAYQLLQRPRVANAIAASQDQVSRVAQVDATFVLQQLGEMQQADVVDIFNDDGTMRLVHEWPLHWRRMVTGVDVKVERYAEDAEDPEDPDSREIVSVTHKVKLIDRARIMEMLGKHTDVRAFVERKEVTVKNELGDRIAAARQRVIDGGQRRDH